MKPTRDRRSFYRIDDTVELNYCLWDDREQAASQTGQDLGISVITMLKEIDRKFNQASNSLWHESPACAAALGLLNRKLSIITTHVLGDAVTNPESFEEVMVNISGSGIGFNSADPFAEGARLFLSLVLKPSNVTLELAGVVVGCEAPSSWPWKNHWIRVCFEDGNEAAQEQLIQHIVQRQSGLIQDRVIAR